LTSGQAALCFFEQTSVIPYRIETLFQYEPWANKLLFGATIATSLALECGLVPEAIVRQYFIWGEGGPLSLLGYQFAHAGFLHLAGNMVFLWVFGNAVCATVGNWTYLALYLGLGTFAGLVHKLVGGQPVVGASGSITGVVGLAVAFYPINKVNLVYSLGLVPRTGRIWLWALALYWTAWDLLGAAFHLGPVAYWAHLGGTAAGLAAGLLLLASGRVELTEFDHGSLLDFLMRRRPPHQAPPASAVAETKKDELRRTARAYLEAYEAKPSPREGLGRTAQPQRLRLKQVTGKTPPAAAPAFAPAAEQPVPAPVQQASAWPASLPDGRYFYFDGTTRYGPVSRSEFLNRVSLTPSTERWWFWTAGMQNWRRVSEIGAALTATRQLRLHPAPTRLR
jgi:membrane associated rhomboid family serine protease